MVPAKTKMAIRLILVIGRFDVHRAEGMKLKIKLMDAHSSESIGSCHAPE